MGTVEAAGYVGIVLRTLYRRIDLGEIPADRMGPVIRTRRADLNAFLKQHRVQPGDLAHLHPDDGRTLAKKSRGGRT